MTIHVIGNSHACLFGGPKYHFKVYTQLPQEYTCGGITYKVWHLGPVIAYNFLESHFSKVEEILSKHVNKETDYVMMLVGEVDCRWHLPKQAELQNRTHEDVVKECVERFFRAYKTLIDRGYKCITWSSHPTTNDKHCEIPDRMIYGDVYTRNRICQLFANELQRLSQENHIPFVNILNIFLKKDGTTDTRHYVDYCHLHGDVLPALTDIIKVTLNNNV